MIIFQVFLFNNLKPSDCPILNCATIKNEREQSMDDTHTHTHTHTRTNTLKMVIILRVYLVKNFNEIPSSRDMKGLIDN